MSNQTLTLGGAESNQTFAVMNGGPIGSKSFQTLDSSLATKENILEYPLITNSTTTPI
jgi:hypothetical protein